METKGSTVIRNKPRFSYCGLTIILSNPSRFDTVNLLSANGGHLFNNFCLRPEFNSMMCDIRVTEDKSPFLPGTKCVLLLGEAALWDWIPTSRDNSLNEVRGSVYYINGIPAIASFFPQDAADMRAHEQTLNVLSKEYVVDSDDYEKDETEDFDSIKKHGKTKRSNYAFWLRADIKRAKQILRDGVPAIQSPLYKTYPPSDEVIKVLTEQRGQHLYFDIETDYEEQNLQCFSFSFDGKVIYNVPILDYNYNISYPAVAHIMRALAIAVRNNTLVAHNGAAFDFFVLGCKYHIPVRKCYDTMIAHHRCYPDIEKSLGHCVSLWTWEQFHKDQDSKGYMTKDQMYARLKYCGKDVYTMFLVHKAIEAYAKTIPGLQSSIDTAMSTIVPYLTTCIQGIRYDQGKVDALKKENDRLMMQYIRIINILIGEAGLSDIKKSVKGKAKAFPGSNTQCCCYFHDLLGYPVVARSKKTGKPSLAKKAMFKLALKHDNPVLKFVLAYRTVQKEYGTLKFIPWKDDNNKIINIREYEISKDRAQHTNTETPLLGEKPVCEVVAKVPNQPTSG